MKKNFKRNAVITMTFAMLLNLSGSTSALAADRDNAMENEPDPYVVSEEDAQAYDTGNLQLTKGLTYVKDGEEIEVTGAIDTMVFCADPTSMEVDGKIYMYATLDQRSYTNKFNNNGDAVDASNDPENGMVIANKYQTKKLAIYSSSDLVNWTDEGVIDMEKVYSDSGVAASAAWAWNSWAPTAMKYDCDGDGKDEYYIFFTNGGDVGYVKGETPTGPWKDELGKLLIRKSEIPDGKGSNIIWDFDPSV
ncbi:MAG: family 43 glycosylhydrolase, partial [Lachnospiraceae bacterium]|nr:family 43 glycosylhydrolase [Lachnospiraceae bacterium]